MEGQIADVTFELSNVYQGGGVPTDQARKLAQSNLSAWWGKTIIHDMTKQARMNLNLRRNAMDSTPVVTPGGGQPNTPGGANSSGANPGAASPVADSGPRVKKYNPKTGKVE